jgi:hypothetical protein
MLYSYFSINILVSSTDCCKANLAVYCFVSAVNQPFINTPLSVRDLRGLSKNLEALVGSAVKKVYIA